MSKRELNVILSPISFSRNFKFQSNQTSKLAGQSASEFCGSLDDEADPVTETSASLEITFLSHYKRKLECLFQNYHYLDAYGRVDESEILLSYQEVRVDSKEAKAAIKMCTQHANAKFQRDDSGDLVFELQTCLKLHSPEFAIVSQRRDELSKDY